MAIHLKLVGKATAVAEWASINPYAASPQYYTVGTAQDLSGLTNPAPEGVYQTTVYAWSSITIGSLVSTSTYKLRFHFSEVYYTLPGQRRIDILVNGVTVINDLDIVAAAGGANKGLIIEVTGLTPDVSNQLIITHADDGGQQTLNGLEVIEIPAATSDSEKVYLQIF